MSCIRFNTAAQREAMRREAPSILESDLVAAKHSSPAITETKIVRLRLLASDAEPKIRESAASSPHSPADLLEMLAGDADAGVRGCVARNEHAPCDLLRRLAADDSETVRGWVAVNFFVPDDVLGSLTDDASETVRALARWNKQCAAEVV